MSCCFGKAIECVRGFWTELTAHRQQFCLDHGFLIQCRMVLLKPTLQCGFLCRGGRREHPVDVHVMIRCIIQHNQGCGSNSNFGDQLVSSCGWSTRPWIMKS